MNKIIRTHSWQPKAVKISLSVLLSLSLMCGLTACKDYLDLKPDKTMVVPSSLADCQAILDGYIVMNINYPVTEHVTDNYFLTYTHWNTQQITQRDGYIWKADGYMTPLSWHSTYQRVLFTNQVLETLGKINPAANEQGTWNSVKGSALFFRAFGFYQLAQLFSKSYDPATAGTDWGIPLRLTADISDKTERATVQQTYDRILKDLHEAVNLLPATRPTSIILKTRPSKAAAHALLARVYLAMGEYNNAGINASLALTNYSPLINYNSLSVAAAGFPIAKYNTEVIFEALAGGVSMLNAATAKVDSVLYQSYDSNDLRKSVFFRQNTGINTGTYQFIGSYSGGHSGAPFCGMATNELYLIRSECFARAGKTDEAMADLNTLLGKRWKSGTYIDITAANAEDALHKILIERRKELLFRGLRWTDLRRLNKDPRFARTLTRNLNGALYTLPPNDLRYTLLIPLEVLMREPMPQNSR